MEAVNCPRCKKLFMRVRESICPECIKEDEEQFETVRIFVKENPNQSLQYVSEQCNVSVKRIMTYIRDGRLEATTGIASEVKCSVCGKHILSGRMCEKCANEVGNKVMSARPIKPGTKSTIVFTSERLNQ